MSNKIEHFLLLLLLTISVLLGLSFWLNTVFGFNLFYRAHWDELARLQASNTPINTSFYISIVVAILIFLVCAYIIYFPNKKSRKQKNVSQDQKQPTAKEATKPEKNYDEPIPVPHSAPLRPPRLKLPTNMAEIVAKKQTHIKQSSASEQNQYTDALAQIFSDNGYVVKPTTKLFGTNINLFAIGTNEGLWLGFVDVDTTKITNTKQRLESIFQETLEDIQININTFVLDTLKQYQPTDSIMVFNTIDDIKTFISQNPNGEIDDTNTDDFNAYSEYIDTILQYVKNI